MANDFLENLFGSIDLIVNSRLNKLNYDKTEVCTIEQVKDNGEYLVSNGSSSYDAYAQGNAEYRRGTQVHVTIPQGDYNNQKIIIGEYKKNVQSSQKWVSPIDEFVNVSGNIISDTRRQGLIANSENTPYTKLIWSDTSGKSYSGYDRVCISADFINDLQEEEKVVDGSYGLILIGDLISDNADDRLKEIEDKIKELENKRQADIEKVSDDNPFKDDEIKLINEAYDKKLSLLNEQKMGLYSLCCVLSTNDMIGNPYAFSEPFNQQILFNINEKARITNLKLYFYRDLNLTTGEFEKTFIYYDENEKKFIEPGTEENIFVENFNISFGYSFNKYPGETALLYTLDKKEFLPNEVGKNENIKRTLKLRWIHHKDGEVYSLQDLSNRVLNGHYVKVHWYRYLLSQGETIEDPLAGYFWSEFAVNKTADINTLFEQEVVLDKTWTEENFKVIIEYDGDLIESEVLEFKNPNGTVRDGNTLTGLKIIYPEYDLYKGNFFFYNELSNESSISPNIPMTLIADYEVISSMTGIWEDDDVICWKIPKDNTMIMEPQAELYTLEKNENGEIVKTVTQYGDYDGVGTLSDDLYISPDENGKITKWGKTWEVDPNYHQILRKIVVADENNGITEAQELESRSQRYRINNFYNNLCKNNTIYCEVIKMKTNIHYNTQVDFSFGYAKTNGTKYTLVVDWEETTFSDKKYKNPGAITWLRNRTDGSRDDSTKRIDFKVKILNSGEDTGEVPVPGSTESDPKQWNINLSWLSEESIDGKINNTHGLNDCFNLENGISPALIIKEDFPDTNGINLYRYAKYQILKLQVTNFEYALTKYIPIPIRTDRTILGIEGATSILYDATGHNPSYSEKAYILRYSGNYEKDKEETKNYKWDMRYYKSTGISNTKTDSKGRTSSILWGTSTLPQLEHKFSYEGDSTTSSEDGYYLVAPNMFMLETGQSQLEAACVFAQTTNGLMLWCQPLLVMCDPYGSQFLNDWDGSMVINETENYIMTSMIGAGTKSTDNKFTGVIMGNLNKIEDSGENTFIDSGILGFQDGVQGFSLSTTGVATLGRPSTGQITLNGDQGYIISGGFNGFNGGKILEDNQQPPRDENGNEKFDFGTLKLDERKGVYLGMDTGNACFAGTLYSSKGEVGGWTLDTHKIYRDYQYNIKDDNGNVIETKTGRTVIQSPDVQDETVINTVFAVGEYTNNSYSNAAFRVLENGKFYATEANITGKITATSLILGDNATVDDGLVKTSDLEITKKWYGEGDNKYLVSNIKFKGNDYKVVDSANDGYLLTDIGKGKPIGDGDLTDPNQKDKYFKVSKEGLLTAHNAIIYGTIYANEGQIAGWTISSNAIYAYNEGKGYTVLKPGGSVGFALGSPKATDTSGANIQLWHDGTIKVGYNGSGYNFVADNKGNVTISGQLHAGSGSSIASWTVDNNSIYAGSWSSATNRVFMCTGTSSNYTIGGVTKNNWIFGASNVFGVHKTEGLFATKGRIGSWTIDSYGLSSSGNIIIQLTPNGMTGVDTYGNSKEFTWAQVLYAIGKSL